MEAMRAGDKYNERVGATLARSRAAEGIVAASALATAVLVAWLPVEAEWRALALAWVAASALRALRALRAGIRIDVHREGRVQIGGREGTLREGSFVAPWLTIVRWRPAGAGVDRTLLVAPGMLAPEDYRRLRVLLRFAAAAGGEPAASGRIG